MAFSVQGAGAGAAAGSAFGPIGTGVGAVVGGFLGGGDSEAPPNLFLTHPLGKKLGRYLEQQLGADLLNDPRLTRYVDAVLSNIRRQFRAIEQRTLDESSRSNRGDALALRRDLAIAESEARQEALTNLFIAFDQNKTAGVFEYLSGGQAAENARASFDLNQDQYNLDLLKLGATAYGAFARGQLTLAQAGAQTLPPAGKQRNRDYDVPDEYEGVPA